MVKKTTQGSVKDSKQGADDELSKSPDLSLPHTCTGQFNIDFTELCKRLQPPPVYIPLVVARPRRPTSPTNLPVIDEKPVKTGRAGKKEDTKNMVAPEPELETPMLTETGEMPEPPPKTYSVKDRFEYFRPCVQVEMETPEKFDSVTEIYIRGWKIDDPMMDVLRQCCTSASKLTTISLWNAGLNDSTIDMLASVLPSLPTLRSLILDNNPAVDAMWHLLLKDESLVQNMSLRFNGITDRAVEKISTALGTISRQNQKLMSLNLAGNEITNKGALHLASGLRFNRCLLSLVLTGNKISDEGAKCLAEVVSRFALTHDEIVSRRKLLSVNVDRKSVGSASPTNRKEKHDRPGSQRSMTTPSQTTSSSTLKGSTSTKQKATAAGKKADSKLSKEEDSKHDKTKGKAKELEKPSKKDLAVRRSSAELGSRRTSTANVVADASKSQTKKPERAAKGKKSAQPTEPEASDAGEMVNPLLEPVETLADGKVLMKGNMMLIHLNLADNQIGEQGVGAFLNAVKYQTTMSHLDTSKTNNYGLMRLSLQRNPIPSHCDEMMLLQAMMSSRDPVMKSSSGRETEMACTYI